MVVYITAYSSKKYDTSDAFVAKVMELRNNQQNIVLKSVQYDKITSKIKMEQIQHTNSKKYTVSILVHANNIVI